MKLPAALEKLTYRFNHLSIRERALVCAATVVGLGMLWTLAMLDPLTAKQNYLASELASLQESISNATQNMEASAAADPVTASLKKEKQLQLSLEDINAQLASKSAGLIAPENMVQVIHDVLSREHGVRLISLHNKPVESLVPAPPKSKATAAADADTSTLAPATPIAGPYVHPVELIVEGEYLDVLAYLHALEALPWRFYWKQLELESTAYPMNRVRIELSTLSMDKDWIGV
jgi:MSHA biogenesis protein MshJ